MSVKVCVKVSELRKQGYSDFKDWLNNKNNIYIYIYIYVRKEEYGYISLIMKYCFIIKIVNGIILLK